MHFPRIPDAAFQRIAQATQNVFTPETQAPESDIFSADPYKQPTVPFEEQKPYRRRLTPTMTYWLQELVNIYTHKKDWVAPKEISSTGGDYAKMMHWGLLEADFDGDGDADPVSEGAQKRKRGKWRPTELGIQFIHGQVQVPSHIFLTGNELQGFSDQNVYVSDLIGANS